MIELLHMDCMEYMAGLEDNTFDICITSPPYNMNLRVNGKGDGYCSRQIVKEISSKYQNYDDNLPMDDYRQFLVSTITELCRVSRMVFFNIQQITGNKPAIFGALGEVSNLLKETIIWDKVVAQPSIAEKTFNSGFEYIFVFGGNPIARQFRECNFDRGVESNVWRIRPKKESTDIHAACFPLAIPEKILRLFAINGSKVFDPFLGNGTTAIASHYMNCEFVGCEIDEDYYKGACERFDRETRQQAMDL